MSLVFSGTGVYRGVHIGNAHGKIALWLTKYEAIGLAQILGSDDNITAELYEAIEAAYPAAPTSEQPDA